MPSQINLQITGRVQNMVFYKRGDKYYARFVSGRIRQTKPRKSVLPNLVKHMNGFFLRGFRNDESTLVPSFQSMSYRGFCCH